VAIQATGLAPPNNLEAAIFATVTAGLYTAILSGDGGGTGIGWLKFISGTTTALLLGSALAGLGPMRRSRSDKVLA